jgi:hypothetical protein
MLIVSKFHDYYDPVAKSKGVDKTIVYKRETLPFECSKIDMLRHSERYSRGDKDVLDLYTYVIGFCGKLYPIGLLQTNKGVTKNTLFHSFDSIKEIYNELTARNLKHPSYGRKYGSRWTRINILSDALQNKKLFDLFQKYKVPVFVIGCGDTDPILTSPNILNPRLKDFKFEKVIDPYQAFQELEMYISGVLGVGEHPTVKISDKNKIIEHGFDYKWSFRKEPTKTKKHKRKE